ncbi:hypothetical protein KIPB_006288 [Kipferlia bialata]|uniref:Transmembrane protein n=1 Tax=Kipferlia bialata TaxID=797122 RepID=A0A9K3D004_9EUKA|nr:hypothetical protein KIPB_006288 [Kipferlia bialata]|eukprot:g6288.t1
MPAWVLLVCSLLPDILLGVTFLVSGLLERATTTLNFTYFWVSHGLCMCVVWSLLTGVGTGILYKNTVEGIVCGGLVLSHWILDFLALPIEDWGSWKIPSLPLLFAPKPHVGLGWYSGGGLVVLEWLGLCAMSFAVAIVASPYTFSIVGGSFLAIIVVVVGYQVYKCRHTRLEREYERERDILAAAQLEAIKTAALQAEVEVLPPLTLSAIPGGSNTDQSGPDGIPPYGESQYSVYSQGGGPATLDPQGNNTEAPINPYPEGGNSAINTYTVDIPGVPDEMSCPISSAQNTYPYPGV